LWRPPLLIPQTTSLGGAPSLARPILATPVRAIVPEVFPGLANSGMSRSSAPDCIDFGIDRLFDCLDASPSSSLVAPLHATVLTAPPRAPATSCAATYPRQPRQLHVDHDYPTHGIIDNDYSPLSRLHRHRHKGLPSA
jgi:hypothetical protein